MRALLLIACVLLPACALALYSKGDAVVQLTASNFDSIVNKGAGVSIVEFYAPWCGHCKNLSPHYKTVAQKLQGIVTLGAVDCDDNANKKLCGRYGIKGFPTIKMFGPDKMKNPYTDEIYREAIDYPGPLTAKGIMDAATSLLSNVHITQVSTVEDFEAFTLKRPEVAKVLLFTSKKDTPAMYKSISMQLYRGLDFAEVHQDAADVVAMHEVVDFPTVMVAKADGSTELYGGGLKATQLLDYLKTFSSEPAEAAETGSDSGPGSEDKAGKPKAQVVRDMTLEEAIALDDQEEMWLLALYSPEEGSDCAEAVTEFKKAVEDMQSVVKAALVSVPVDKIDEVSHYGASPSKLRANRCTLQLVLLPFGDDKADAEDYSLYSGDLEGKSLQKWVTDATPSSFTSEVSPQNFQYFMADVLPGGSKPQTAEDLKSVTKIMLFTNKDEVPGVFKALATNFRQSFGFGWVQTTKKENKPFVTQFEVTKVPSLIMVKLTPVKDKDGSMAMAPSAVAYRGPMRYNSMAAWLAALSAMMGGAPGSKGSEEAAAQLLPEVAHNEALEEHCSSKGGICVLGLLDPSHEKHDVTKKMLADMALKRDGQPFHFCWLDATKFRPVAAAFGVSSLPSVVALSAKRLRYASLAAKDAESIGTFLDGVLSGKVRTDILQELPSVTEGAGGGQEAEAGAEAAEVVEEEFDLSDIMSEEVEGADLGSKGDKLKRVEEELKAEEEARKAAQKPKKKSKKSKKKGKKSSDKSEL